MKIETMQATARRPDTRRAMERTKAERREKIRESLRREKERRDAAQLERIRRIIRIMQNGFKQNEGRIMLEYPGAAPRSIWRVEQWPWEYRENRRS